MIRIVVCFAVFACFIVLQACSNLSSQLSPQQIAAYSAATGFLTLCDDGDFKGALDFYAGPMKSRPGGATWITQMRGKRAPFGLPIGRYWVNRQGLNEAPNMTFQFRASFLNEPQVDEIVAVTRTSGRWQVYDYKFHALGKHPSPSPTPTPKPSPRAPSSPPSRTSGTPPPGPSPSEPPLPGASP
jgi:hypothetical protein